jgi:hypothetical protein
MEVMERLVPIREYTPQAEFTALTEAVEGTDRKDLYIQGPFLQGDIKNRNGRIYPAPMLGKAVEDFMKTKVRGVGVPGELNHPQSSIQIDLERVSHYITQLTMQGSDGIGKAKIATTPTGMIARALIDDGMTLGVSTRGVGKLDEDNGEGAVVSEFELVTIDIVADPSAPNAFVQAVMEGLHYYVDSDTKDIQVATTIEEMLQNMAKNLETLPKKTEAKNDKIFQNISNILNSLK